MKKYSTEYFLSIALILFVFGSIIEHNMSKDDREQERLASRPIYIDMEGNIGYDDEDAVLLNELPPYYALKLKSKYGQ